MPSGWPVHVGATERQWLSRNSCMDGPVTPMASKCSVMLSILSLKSRPLGLPHRRIPVAPVPEFSGSGAFPPSPLFGSGDQPPCAIYFRLCFVIALRLPSLISLGRKDDKRKVLGSGMVCGQNHPTKEKIPSPHQKKTHFDPQKASPLKKKPHFDTHTGSPLKKNPHFNLILTPTRGLFSKKNLIFTSF